MYDRPALRLGVERQAWGRVDPEAGAWFPEQAIELAEKTVPRL